MRKTVVIFCVAGLGLSLALVGLKKNTGQANVPLSPNIEPALQTIVSDDPALDHQTKLASVIGSDVAQISDSLRAQILASLKSGEASDHARVFNELLPALVKLDPAAAAALAETAGLENGRSEMLRVVARRWADKNSEDALAWASSLSEPSERDQAMSYVALQAGDTNPVWAIRALEKNWTGSSPSTALDNLAQRWAEKDFAAASAWVANQPAGEDKDRLVVRVALTQSATDPVKAAQIVVEQMPAGPAQNNAVLTVLNQWAMQDRRSASAWVDKFPEGELQKQARQMLTELAAYQAAESVTAK